MVGAMLKNTIITIVMIWVASSCFAQSGTDHIPVPDGLALVWDESPVLPVSSRYGEPLMSAGLGVDAQSGNLFLKELDFQWTIFNQQISFNHYYNSLSGITSTMGLGWRHSFMVNLFKYSSQYYLLVEEDGREVPFHKLGGKGYALSDTKLDTLFFLRNGSYLLRKFDKTLMDFDFKGQLIKVSNKNQITFYLFYDNYDRLSSIIDQVGRQISFAYEAGRLVAITPFFNAKLKLVYNENKRLVKAITNEELMRQYGYNDEHKLELYKDFNTSIFNVSYNLAGKVKRVVEPSGDFEDFKYPSLVGMMQLNSMRYAHSKNGLTKYSYRFRTFKTTIAANGHRKFKLNRFGQLTKSWIDGELEQQISYDSHHRAKEINGNNAKSNFEYDTKNRLVLMKSDAKEVKCKYNEESHLVGIIDESAMKLTRFERNLWGRISKITDEKEITCYYDTVGNLIRLQFEKDAERFSYDQAGNLLAYSDSMGNSISAKFNDLNQMTELRLSVDWKLKMDYDRAGNLIRISYPSGSTISYAYNRLNWLMSETFNDETNYFYYNACGEIVLPDERNSTSSIRFGSYQKSATDYLNLNNQEVYTIAQQLKAGKTRIFFNYKNPNRKPVQIPVSDYLFTVDLTKD